MRQGQQHRRGQPPFQREREQQGLTDEEKQKVRSIIAEDKPDDLVEFAERLAKRLVQADISKACISHL